MSTYAIGDLQGCYKSFKQLLKEINFQPGRDRLWLAGDLVNRGTGSLNVLRYVADLGVNSIQVLGNHDFHLLAVAAGARKLRSGDTLADILAAPDAKQLLRWLAQQPLLHHDKELGYVMTHAGIPPIWHLKQAKKLAHKVEQRLTTKHKKEFLQHVFGNKPAKWSEDLKGYNRYRCIINYFTRMRFCLADGTLDFSSKNSIDNAPEGFAPWFWHPSQVTAKAQILFGHWAALDGFTGSSKIHALDTGCVWGNYLTAMRLEDGKRFSVPAHKKDLK